MSALLKWTLLLLGAGCVLLAAGAFPLAGVPAVYKGGLMLMLGVALAALSLVGAWRLSAGARLRLVCGMVCLALACAGAGAAWAFGERGFDFAHRACAAGQPAGLFGAAAYLCMGVVGALFVAIFGFLLLRLMSRRLWLAALHACVVPVVAGGYIDFAYAEVTLHRCSVRPGAELHLPAAGRHGAVDLSVLSFDVERYADGESYALLRHDGSGWQQVSTPVRRGDVIELGSESRRVSELTSAGGMAPRYLRLPGEPPRLLVEYPAPVREYRAACRLRIHRHGAVDEREEVLRVNHPLRCEGRLIYLLNFTPPVHPGAPVMVDLQVRRAPGRLMALIGMAGIILASLGWAFTPKNTHTTLAAS